MILTNCMSSNNETAIVEISNNGQNVDVAKITLQQNTERLFSSQNMEQKNNYEVRAKRSKKIQQLSNEQENKKQAPWNSQELNQFKRLFATFGSNWTEIAQKLKGRKVNQLKNWFSNSIRKLSNRLEEHSWQLKQRVQRQYRAYLLSMLQIANQAEGIIIQKNLTPNRDCRLLRFKFLLLQICFSLSETNDAQVQEIIKLTKILGLRLKCLGVFKAKNKKKWKLTQKSFENILQFDPLVIQCKQHMTKMELKINCLQEFTLNPMQISLFFPSTSDKNIDLIQIKSQCSTLQKTYFSMEEDSFKKFQYFF